MEGPHDKQQLAPVLEAISPTTITHVLNVLADSGYYSEAAVETIEREIRLEQHGTNDPKW